jgi:2'-5' RNA ligase
MHNVRYDYSSCHINVPPLLAEDIINWGRSEVSDDDLYVTHKEPTFGREDEIHITILYGIHSENGNQIRSALEGAGPVKVVLGKTEVFTNPYKFDVVMIEAQSDDLVQLNLILQEKVSFSNKYPIYNPHVTIAYVKKNKGWKHRGISLWEGKEFTCYYAVFSSKNGIKERIIL